MAGAGAGMWSREQDKAFEKAIARYAEGEDDEWLEKIADEVGGGISVEEVKHHYQLLLDDLNTIESGFVELPCYNNHHSISISISISTTNNSSSTTTSDEPKKGNNNNNNNRHHLNGGGDGANNNNNKSCSRSDQERRKGIAWTEDEHRLFLLGLDKYGKGDWRSISRNFVVTRTPTQVASHAQKYFIRLNSMNKDRRRSSIHDITSVNNGDVSVPQGPITGQTNGSVGVGGQSGKSNKQPPQVAPGVAMYGPPTIGQPIGGPLVSAVGTPVNLPPQPPPHLVYPMVPGAPMNMSPMTYPLPHTSAHR